VGRTLFCILVSPMYQVVIDTNVLVAGLLSNRGASHRLLRLVGSRTWMITVPLVLEYEQTIKRVCTPGTMNEGDVDDVLDYLCATGNLRPIYFLWRSFLPDPKDDFVLEPAIESRADFLITFNTKDFAGAESFGVRLLSPREFLVIIGEVP
jgi:putative PIN family toxin of toxin-antitoxin system